MTKTLIVVLIALASGCGGDDSFTSTPETTPEEKAACETNVTGRITLMNGATQVETVALNGIDYGKINTGASIDVDLPPGEYSVQFYWLDGSQACTQGMVTISVCSTQSLVCPAP